MVHFGVFVLGFSLSFWSFTAAHTEDEGRHLVGPRQPIEASEGDDVILLCSVSPDYNVEDLTVEWSLPDLKPDPSDRLSRVEYVFVYRRRREEVDMKLQKFVGRTELFEDELKVGNISLKISNVTLADAGKYRCFIPKLKGRVKEAVVRLVVEPRANITLTTETQTSSQTPDPNQETDVKVGQPELWILVLSVCIVLVMVVVGCGVAHVPIKRCVKALTHHAVFGRLALSGDNAFPVAQSQFGVSLTLGRDTPYLAFHSRHMADSTC